jgi:hypothetical protein
VQEHETSKLPSGRTGLGQRIDWLPSFACNSLKNDDNRDGGNFMLTALHRETFLVTDDLGGEGTMHVIDIRNSVLNYLLSCDDVDHGGCRNILSFLLFVAPLVSSRNLQSCWGTLSWYR